MSVKISNTKKAIHSLKNGEDVYYLDNGRLFHAVKINNEVFRRSYAKSSEKELLDDPKVLTVLELFTRFFRSDVKDGTGIGMYMDEDNKFVFEADIIRVHDKIAENATELNSINGMNSVIFSNTAKIKLIDTDYEND